MSVSTVAIAVASAPNKCLRAVHGPVGFVVELSRIPESLIGKLGHANGMRGWAGIGGAKPPSSQYRTYDLGGWGCRGSCHPSIQLLLVDEAQTKRDH